jgi:hypothetical protein
LPFSLFVIVAIAPGRTAPLASLTSPVRPLKRSCDIAGAMARATSSVRTANRRGPVRKVDAVISDAPFGSCGELQRWRRFVPVTRVLIPCRRPAQDSGLADLCLLKQAGRVPVQRVFPTTAVGLERQVARRFL